MNYKNRYRCENRNNPYYYDYDSNDLDISVRTGMMNNYNINTDDSSYRISKERKGIREKLALEGDLERELEEYRNNIENETRNFEENLKREEFKDVIERSDFTVDRLLYNIEEATLYLEHSNFIIKDKIKNKIDNKYNKLEFVIPRQFDIMNKIYLIIDIPEDFVNLPIEDKLSILDITFDFTIGGSLIDNMSLLTSIFLGICEGQNIEQQDNKLIIPLMNFNNYMQKKSINYKYDSIGIPLIALQYSETKIIIKYPENLAHYKFSLKVNGLFSLDTEYRRYLAHNSFEYPIFITEKNESVKLLDYHKPMEINLKLISKCFFIYFTPENIKDSDRIMLNYPVLTSAKLKFNGIFELDFDEEDILSIDILGIKIYILSFSKEFDTWETIMETFKDRNNKLSNEGINLSMYGKTTLYLNFENNDNDNLFNINIINFSFNLLRIMSGMAGKAFSD